MITKLFALILLIISKFSYLGLIFLMTLESANIPIPSELVMPFAGYLVFKGTMNIHVAAFSGAIGCLIGSLISYYLGYYGGRPLLEKYGKYILLTDHDLDIGENLFRNHGDKISFISRLLPIVRTFISFPAGIMRMDIKKFIIYSFIGSLIWSYFLIFIGEKIGKNQVVLSPIFHKFDYLILALVLIGVIAYVYMHIKRFKKNS